MAAFNGSWTLAQCDGLADLLQELGVGEAAKQALMQPREVKVEFAVEGDHFRVRHHGLKEFEYEFDVGKEHEEELFGRQVTLSTTKEGDSKLVHVGKGANGELKITREVADNAMIVTTELEGKEHKLVLKFTRDN